MIVAHGGTIRACLAHLLPDQLGEWWTYRLANGGLKRVQITEAGAELITLDDTTHLASHEEEQEDNGPTHG
jgi:broad specificity phosphatase PhoE